MGVTILMWVLVGICFVVLSRRQTAATNARVAQAEARADSVVEAYHRRVTVATQTAYASKRAGQAERAAAERLTTQLRTMQDSLDALQLVSLDTAASADSLRQALTDAIHLADTLTFQVSGYMGQVDTLRAKYAAERLAMSSALNLADSALAHQDALIRTLRKQAECRVLGFRCPPRTTVAVVALVAGLLTR